MNFPMAFKDRDKIEYLATDGVWYKLKDMYPMWIAVQDHPERIYLDTGGHMQDCHFCIVELRDDGFMWRQDEGSSEIVKTNNKWRLRA